MSRRRIPWGSLCKLLGVAGLAGVAATGVVAARAERRRRAYTADEVRARLQDRIAAAQDTAAQDKAAEDAAARDAAPASPEPPPCADGRPPATTPHRARITPRRPDR